MPGFLHTKYGALGLILGAFVAVGACAARGQQVPRPAAPAEALEARGVALVRQGRARDAIEPLEQAVRAEPTNPYLLNALGAAFSLLGEEGKAQGCFLKALRNQPGFLPAEKNLAISYFKSGRLPQAEAQFAPLDRIPSTQKLAELFLGMIATKNRQYEKAANLLAEAGPLTLEEPEGALAFAQSLYAQGEREKAGEALARLAGAVNQSPLNHFHAGLLDCRLGLFPSAATEFAAVKDSPSAPRGIEYYQAYAEARMGDPAQGRDILRRMADANPKATFLNDLTRFAEQSDNYEVALQAIRSAGDLQPAREQNYLDFSTLCMNSRSYVVGLQIVNAGLARNGPSYRLLVQKGALLDKLTSYDKAAQAFLAAERLQQDNRVAVLGLAIAQEHGRQFNEAAATLRAGAARFPKDPRMPYYQGVAFARMADAEGASARYAGYAAQAKSAFSQAIRIDPSFAGPYCELAKLSAGAQPREAIGQYEQCLARKPHNYLAEYQLGRLYLRVGDQARSKRLLALAAADRQAATNAEQQLPQVDAAGAASAGLDASLQKELP